VRMGYDDDPAKYVAHEVRGGQAWASVFRA
jgi:hypothetical protein